MRIPLCIGLLSISASVACTSPATEVDPESATQDIVTRDGRDHLYVPTEGSLSAARAKVDGRNAAVSSAADRRDGFVPYAMFHPAGEAIRGAVLLFHGFSSRPHQMSVLAQYLFDHGYDVYLPNLYGQASNNPSTSWAKTTLKPEYQDKVRSRLDAEGLSALIRNDPARKMSDDPGLILKLALMANNPFNGDVSGALKAANDYDDDSAFDTYMTSTHGQYLEDAEARLGEIAGLEGREKTEGAAWSAGPVKKIPIFTVGLSVGGSVALRLAEEHPDRISGVVAYAPLLRQLSKTKTPFAVEEFFVNAVGPVSSYFFSSWGPAFPLASFTAANRFGSEARKNAAKMRDVPLFIVSTENEDAADNPAQAAFFNGVGGAGRNFAYTYTASQKVPHPMVHPAQVSQGMQNAYWKTLYRETLRFLDRGKVSLPELSRTEPSTSDHFPPINEAP